MDPMLVAMNDKSRGYQAALWRLLMDAKREKKKARAAAILDRRIRIGIR